MISEYEFQDLTVELLAREPDLKSARLHGRRGQMQFGVDATAKILEVENWPHPASATSMPPLR